MSDLVSLAQIYAQLSLLAVGGVSPVLPEMQRQVVDQHGWMTAREFAALFALAQAAPGPNVLVSTLVGARVAGIPGAIVATLGMVGPSSVLSWFTASAWERFRDRTWRKIVQAGLVPVTVGLVIAAAALLTESTTHGWLTAAITALAAAGMLATRLHPLLLLGAGAGLGVLGGL